MALESLFSGAALQGVDADGGMVLPSFVLRTLARRSEAQRVLFGPHEVDPCMSGYDESYAAWLYAEVERRRLREESLGLGPADHHRRARRTFGAVEAASYDAHGRVTLPPMMRRRSRIHGAALVVGTGGSFEIWNPDVAREAGDEELRALAAFALADRDGGEAREVEA